MPLYCKACREHEALEISEGVSNPVDRARVDREEHLGSYPLESAGTVQIQLADVSVGSDGTVRVVITARTYPPLAGWFLRGTGTAVPLTVEGEARAR